MICSHTPTGSGTPFSISSATQTGQNFQSTAALAGGGFFAVWTDGEDLVGQIFDDAGQTTGAEFTIGAADAYRFSFPSVTLLSDDSLIVTWTGPQDPVTADQQVYVRHYDATGVAEGAATTLDLDTDREFPRPDSIAATSTGGYIVSFRTFNPNELSLSDHNSDIALQIFDSNDVSIAGPISVNVSASYALQGSNIAIASDNAFVVTWVRYENDDGLDDNDIYGQRFNADGTLAGSAFLVPTTTAGYQSQSDVTYLSDDSFVVSWSSNLGVDFQQFDSDGTPQGGEMTATPSGQQSRIVALPDGGFVIVWVPRGSGDIDIEGQRFDAEGQAIGDTFSIASAERMHPQGIEITLLANGTLAVSASGYFTVRGGSDIFGQILTLSDETLGTGNDDVLVGTQDADWISGLAGDDTITGKGDGDCLFGGAGNDTLSGLDGNDLLVGDEGNDHILGGTGDDTAYGGDGDDTIRGGGNMDTLYGDTGADNISGGTHDDEIYGGGGGDLIKGGGGADFINGDGGADTIFGKLGDDVINGRSGADIIRGGNGNDIASGGGGADMMFGSSGNDAFFGAKGDDFIKGGSGNDALAGGKGSDVIYGGSGHDILFGNDSALSSTDSFSDRLYGGSGNDGLNGGHGDDVLTGGRGNDELYGSLGKDLLRGGSGADTFIFWSPAESRHYSRGRDVIEDFKAGIDTIDLAEMGGNSDFTFIGDNQFSGAAMELNVTFNGTNTIVRADLDGGGNADFSIELTGNIMLSADDFIL